MNVLAIYGSIYGTSKAYALELANRLKINCFAFDESFDLTDVEIIVYFGGLYAGGVLGLKDTLSKIKQQNIHLIIVTVGLADPEEQENTGNIMQSLRKQIPEDVLRKATIFHLRGGIDYKKLNFKHSLMMKLLHQKAKNLPREKQTPEVQAMIETYASKVDFVDYGNIDKIIAVIK